MKTAKQPPPADGAKPTPRQLQQAVLDACSKEPRSMVQIIEQVAQDQQERRRVRDAVYFLVRSYKLENTSMVEGTRIRKEGLYIARDTRADTPALERLNFAPLLAAWLGPWHEQRMAGWRGAMA